MALESRPKDQCILKSWVPLLPDAGGGRLGQWRWVGVARLAGARGVPRSASRLRASESPTGLVRVGGQGG